MLWAVVFSRQARPTRLLIFAGVVKLSGRRSLPATRPHILHSWRTRLADETKLTMASEMDGKQPLQNGKSFRGTVNLLSAAPRRDGGVCF